jgi:hypothetical protein
MAKGLVSVINAADRPLADSNNIVSLLTLVMGITDRGAGRTPAQSLVDRYGASPHLGSLSLEDLTAIGGIGVIRARRLRAAFALGKWLNQEDPSRPVSREKTVDLLTGIRGFVGPGQTVIIAYRPEVAEEPIILSSGTGFGSCTPIGGFLAHMLPHRNCEWWVILLRPGEPPKRGEREVATRLREAAQTLGVNLTHVFLLTGRRRWTLAAGVNSTD